MAMTVDESNQRAPPRGADAPAGGVPPRRDEGGLCQDRDRRLARWFSSRLDSRETVRRWFGEQRRKLSADAR
jgi:hypothetical protein